MTQIKKWLLRPTFSNIETASYQLAKYLAKLLFLLSKLQYTVKSTKEFIDMIKNGRTGSACRMILFDVSSLFTTVPLDYTIDLILKQIYGDKDIETKINGKDK